jgi:aminoglycoside/choline kinase family phosphotransferase
MSKTAFLWAGIREEEALPLAGDASTRQYFRVPWKQDSTAVLMVFQKDDLSKRQSMRFEWVQTWLSLTGIPVPEIFRSSEDRRFYLLEDLGDRSLETVLAQNPGSETVLSHYLTLSRYCRMIQEADKPVWLSGPEPLAKPRLLWELHFFNEHYCNNPTIPELDIFYNTLAETAAGNKMTAAHRDLHCRNILLHKGKLFVIDFQDLRLAHPLYDIASFLYDAYYDPGPEVRGKVLNDWNDTDALPAVALQRNLKAIGSFAYQIKVRHKPLYASFIPRCLNYSQKHMEDIGWPCITDAVKKVIFNPELNQ